VCSTTFVHSHAAAYVADNSYETWSSPATVTPSTVRLTPDTWAQPHPAQHAIATAAVARFVLPTKCFQFLARSLQQQSFDGRLPSGLAARSIGTPRFHRRRFVSVFVFYSRSPVVTLFSCTICDLFLLLRPHDVWKHGRPLCFADVLFFFWQSHAHSNLPDDRDISRQKYIRGLVLHQTHKIHSVIDPNPPLIFTGSKSAKVGQDVDFYYYFIWSDLVLRGSDVSEVWNKLDVGSSRCTTHCEWIKWITDRSCMWP